MAEALLRDRLARLGVEATVSSAGELPGGVHASPGSVSAMRARGLDISQHRSRATTRELLAGADLVVAMARRHLRNAVAVEPAVFARTFTLKELVRRAASHGARHPDQALADWLDGLHAGRTTQALLSEDPRDDVADPIGGPPRLYEATARELEELVDRLVALAFPANAQTPLETT
jgi:protein-tyrosine phosphatase